MDSTGISMEIPSAKRWHDYGKSILDDFFLLGKSSTFPGHDFDVSMGKITDGKDPAFWMDEYSLLL